VADPGGIAGRKALVTGAASGVGREVARRLAGLGAGVALLDVQDEALAAAADEVGGVAVRADVRSVGEVHEAVARAAEQLGGLDTLVICAGVLDIEPLADVSEATWDRALDVNLKGAFFCAQAAAPGLRASGRGRIVAIASDAGRRGVPLLHPYTASKFGLVGITESLAAELAPEVTVNAVCPVGIPTTEMGRQVLLWKSRHTGREPDDVLERIAREFPLGRSATEGDIADAVLFFISDAASFVTGVSLDVDGGASLNAMPGATA
jgi:NAD(P)-dependent dehydrogenase (short-subunit alcohol dehydrogenase family)